MIFCNSNNFKNGLKIVFNNIPFNIENSEFVKPGKGQTFVRVKMRNLINNKLIEKTFRSNENLKVADIENIKISFLYRSEEIFYFINLKNYNEISIEKKFLKNVLSFIVPGKKYFGLIWNNKLISVVPKNFINLKVIGFDQFSKNKLNYKNKLAILKTRLKVIVPSFIKINDIIKIDTRSSKYISRKNNK
ncbi:elongation factor P [Buchnera aphidicola (Ceratovacuna keduensis)]|uniref:elongation factor P n=1 Tax=Buchnera aphidicola TaxID=9 RepID=UPI0031B85195